MIWKWKDNAFRFGFGWMAAQPNQYSIWSLCLATGRSNHSRSYQMWFILDSLTKWICTKYFMLQCWRYRHRQRLLCASSGGWSFSSFFSSNHRWRAYLHSHGRNWSRIEFCILMKAMTDDGIENWYVDMFIMLLSSVSKALVFCVSLIGF